MSGWLNRAISAHGRLVEAVDRRSDQIFFEKGDFPWLASIEAGWRDVRSELDRLLCVRESIPRFHQISPRQQAISGDWKTAFLLVYGHRIAEAERFAPATMRLLSRIEGAQTAMFSILGPGVRVPPHRGPFKGVLRLHLGLKIPGAMNVCGISVGGVRRGWSEGEAMVFDDTHLHEAWNLTELERVVLFVDFLRPLPRPANWLNRAAFELVSRMSPDVAVARDNATKWARSVEGALAR